jgi:hypothetical protein
MEKDDQYAMDWKFPFAQAEEQWRQWMDLVAEQDPNANGVRDIVSAVSSVPVQRS